MIKSKQYLTLMILVIFAISSIATAYAAPAVPASTQKIPNPFWKLAPLYEKAIMDNNLNDIIAYGNQIIELFNGMEQTRQVLEIVAPRLDRIARTYEAMGDYYKAVDYFNRYLPLAEKLGWKDGVTYAASKVKALTFDIELYAKVSGTQGSITFNEKYEPAAGIYFGSGYDVDPRIGTFKWESIKKYFPKKDSAYLLYLHWEEDIASFDRYYQDARKNSIGVQLAWNIEDSRMDSVLKNIRQYEAYIRKTARYLSALDIPVFLRFACEMNIKENSKDANAYIEAFRYVAGIMRTEASNVAMVWSPNDFSAKDRTYEQYYPGDDFVDWIGISTYTGRYFQGKKDWGTLQDSIDSVFMTGDYANPLAKIKPILELYGKRKPVMISETGVSHYTKALKEDLSDWASIQLKRLYIYGPMVYPQLKGIFYFNVDGDTLTKHDNYSLYGNNKIGTLYNQLVSDEYFLSQIGQTAASRFEKVVDFPVTGTKAAFAVYTVVPKVLQPTVQYKLDDKILGSSRDLPYGMTVDFGGLTPGEHKLTIEVYHGNSRMGVRNYQVIINSGQVQIKKVI